MALRSKQGGMSAVGILLVLVFLAICVPYIFTIGMLNLDNYIVAQVLHSIDDVEKMDKLDDQQIVKALQKRFQVNNIRGKPTKSVKVDRTVEQLLISVDYEMRKTVYANIDVAIFFENHYIIDLTK